MSEYRCVRCKLPLTESGPSYPGIAFFDCLACGRQYALKPGKGLTFRWLHPISLALYGIQCDEFPSRRVEEIIASFISWYPIEQLRSWAREIALELEEPSQRVRDILDCRAPEGELRDFLRRFVAGIETMESRRPRSRFAGFRF